MKLKPRTLVVIALAVVCVSTALVAALAQDPGDSSWWAAWAILSGGSVVIIAVISAYRRSALGAKDHALYRRSALGAKDPALSATATEDYGSIGNILGFIVLLSVCFVTGGYGAVWLFPEREFAYSWCYYFEHGLENATIQVDPKPHDCEFLTAPMGSKHCHYERSVTTVRVRREPNGLRFVSFDDGKTWQTGAQLQLQPTVYVSWQKIAD